MQLMPKLSSNGNYGYGRNCWRIQYLRSNIKCSGFPGSLRYHSRKVWTSTSEANKWSKSAWSGWIVCWNLTCSSILQTQALVWLLFLRFPKNRISNYTLHRWTQTSEKSLNYWVYFCFWRVEWISPVGSEHSTMLKLDSRMSIRISDECYCYISMWYLQICILHLLLFHKKSLLLMIEPNWDNRCRSEESKNWLLSSSKTS